MCVCHCLTVCVCVCVCVFCFLRNSSYSHIESTFLFQIYAPQGEAMLVHSSLILMKSRKMLARDVFDTFARHDSLVYDVTDADCWA